MYEGWKLERWETPFSNERLGTLTSLVDDGERLVIMVGDSSGQRFRFAFTDYPAYRNIQELYRTELWNKLYERNLGSTLIIPESEWIASLKREGFEIYYPDAVHYMICTDDGCVEVLSDTLPEITKVEVNSDEL